MRPESRPISSYLRNSPPGFEARAFLSDETEKADVRSSPQSGHLQCTSAHHRIAGYPGGYRVVVLWLVVKRKAGRSDCKRTQRGSGGATASPSIPLRVTESARKPLERMSASAALTNRRRSGRSSGTATACGTP